jgi:hypothetical protein
MEGDGKADGDEGDEWDAHSSGRRAVSGVDIWMTEIGWGVSFPGLLR